MLDSKSGGPGFDSCSCHLLDLFSVVSSSNAHPGCLLPVGGFNSVMLYLHYLFQNYLSEVL